jgi:hypothetical protein
MTTDHPTVNPRHSPSDFWQQITGEPRTTYEKIPLLTSANWRGDYPLIAGASAWFLAHSQYSHDLRKGKVEREFELLKAI